MPIVYALTNRESFKKDWVKIGRTTRTAHVRAVELSGTSVPYPFEVQMAFEVADATESERALHDHFANHRVRGNREFFDVDLVDVRAQMETLGGTEVTQEVIENPKLIDQPVWWTHDGKACLGPEPESRSGPRKHGQYFRMGLRKGDVINSIEFPNYTAIIATNRKVIFESNLVFLASATRSVYSRHISEVNRRIETSVSKSFKMWEFESENLFDIYDRTYADGGYI